MSKFPFSELDRWVEENCPEGHETVEDALHYVDKIRDSRVNKDCLEWQ